MPDLTPLPRLTPAPPVAVDVARLAAARAAGYRRRHRRGAAATLSAVALAGVGSFSPGTGGTAGVAPAGQATASAPAPAAERPEVRRSRPLPAGRAPAADGVRTAPRPAPAGRPAAPGAPATPWPDVPPPPLPPRPPKPAVVEVDSTLTVVADDGSACTTATTRTGAPRPWCVRSGGAGPLTAGARTESRLEICRTGGTAGELHFEDGAHLDVLLWQGDDTVWSRGTTAQDALGHTTVPSGQCARWTIHWYAVGDDGTALPAGSYRLSFATFGGGEHDVTAGDGVLTDGRYTDSYALTVA